jgi:chromosome segregation ATPase
VLHFRFEAAKINNDTVAIEAGRKKGSIKKSRPQHATLIAAIDAANEEARRPQNEVSNRLQQAKDDSKELRRQLDAAYARELSLAREVMELRRELKDLRGGNVIPIRGPRADSGS